MGVARHRRTCCEHDLDTAAQPGTARTRRFSSHPPQSCDRPVLPVPIDRRVLPGRLPDRAATAHRAVIAVVRRLCAGHSRDRASATPRLAVDPVAGGGLRRRRRGRAHHESVQSRLRASASIGQRLHTRVGNRSPLDGVRADTAHRLEYRDADRADRVVAGGARRTAMAATTWCGLHGRGRVVCAVIVFATNYPAYGHFLLRRHRWGRACSLRQSSWLSRSSARRRCRGGVVRSSGVSDRPARPCRRGSCSR